MQKTFILLLGLLVGSFGLTALAAAPGPAKIKVLLVSGDDVGAHKWREISEATRTVLVSSGKFDVRVCEDAAVLEAKDALKRYDLIFLTAYNANTPTLSDEAKENLLSFVKSGKGFAVSHLASASYKEWPEFRQLCGRYWVMGKSGHGPRGDIKAKIASADHPITKGLDEFETNDELYAKLEGDAPINVLVTADSDWSKRTEPLAFTLAYGEGRVFHETFGHDGAAIKNPEVAELIVRGCEWAATGKVQ